MSTPPQDESGRLTSRGTSKPTGQKHQKTSPVDIKPAKAPVRRIAATAAQSKAVKPVPHSTPKLVKGSSIKGGSSTLPLLQHPVVHTNNDGRSNPILCIELERKHPKDHWFDSYDSLDTKMSHRKHKSKDGKELRFAVKDLQIPLVGAAAGFLGGTTVHPAAGTGLEKRIARRVGLQKAVRETISYLLDVEADWNPVTLIDRKPAECLYPLWEGNLWLGGIKDSINEALLTELEIDAVVSIHPDDWLWKETCGKLFQNGSFKRADKFPSGKRVEVKHYAIHLADDSSSDLLAEFKGAFKFMDSYLLHGKKVLVHCKMGQSRSTSLVLAYKMYRYHMHRTIFPKPPPKQRQKAPTDLEKKAAEDLELGILKAKLKSFTDEISMPPENGPSRYAKRVDQKRRRGISTQKFQEQLSSYLHQLVKGSVEKKEPVQQQKPAEKKGGGGIIKDAVIVFCYMNNLTPTQEILDYWLSRRHTNQHYWMAASRANTPRRIGVNASGFKDFFEREQALRARK